MKKIILVVEDDQKIARVIELQLKYSGYDVEVVHDGKKAEVLIEANSYALILLDVMLPGLNGFELCRRMREVSNVPIIMVTAKDDVTDKVIGLDFGANDYITKPFDMEELRARIRVQLRPKTQIEKPTRLKVHDVEINCETMQVKIANHLVRFTKTEFDLLVYLADNKDFVYGCTGLLKISSVVPISTM
jgi:DNA-binding response OmpR family regulator